MRRNVTRLFCPHILRAWKIRSPSHARLSAPAARFIAASSALPTTISPAHRSLDISTLRTDRIKIRISQRSAALESLRKYQISPAMRHAARPPFQARRLFHTERRSHRINDFPRFLCHNGKVDNMSAYVKDISCTDLRGDLPDTVSMKVTASTTPSSIFNVAFCARTKELRKARGWTQAQMAEALGIEKAAYSKYENRSPLPHWLIPRFCLFCDASPDEMFTVNVKIRPLASSTGKKNSHLTIITNDDMTERRPPWRAEAIREPGS